MKGSWKMEGQKQEGYQETAFDEYKRKVVECLMKREQLTEEEAMSWLSEDTEWQTADGPQTGDALLAEFCEEGLSPQGAVAVFLEL